VIPRSIIYSVVGIASIYLLTTLSIISVIPWREAMHSKFIAADFMMKLYGARAAGGVTVLVLWTALASVFALLFGYSRIPYAAALNGDFFKVFARLHPTGDFPHVSLIVMGGLSIVACLWTLDDVITALVTSRIIIQFIAQIFALGYLRKHRAEMPRPFRMWLYPLPAAIAFVGWAFLFLTSGWKFAGFGVLTLVAGVGAYWIWTRSSHDLSQPPSGTD
jgi:APA family basic amino acid/polyamine antiporter